MAIISYNKRDDKHNLVGSNEPASISLLSGEKSLEQNIGVGLWFGRRLLVSLLVLLAFVFSPTIFQLASAQENKIHPVGVHKINAQFEHIKRINTALIDFHSGAYVLSWSGLGRVEEIGGRNCLVGPYFLFDVDDSWAFDIDETVTVEVDLARGTGVLASYDHAVSAPVAQTTSAHGNKITLTLDRARFANRLLEGHDFALGAQGAVYPYVADREHNIAICGVRLSRGNATAPKESGVGRLRLKLREARTGLPTAARVGVYDASGRMPLPSKQALSIGRYEEQVRQFPIITSRQLWPAPGGYAFFVDGEYNAELPPGNYRVVVMKGYEYHVQTMAVHVKEGQDTNLEVDLARWADAPAAGWYSGDTHTHITRDKPDYDPALHAYTHAEDLHVINPLQMGNIVRYHFPQYAFGPPGRYVRDSYAIVSGQESPRSGHRGHTLELNASRWHENKNEYFLYHKIAESIHADGGLFGYAHLLADAFHATRGLALDAPLGLVDFAEILQFGLVATDIYYDMLNLGFRLAPSAGSDYPYIDMPGAVRNYVHIAGAFSTDAWFDGLRRGHTYVSNGPLLELDVNGVGMGETVRIAPGVPVRVRAKARMNPGLDRLDRLELVVHGRVVASTTSGSGAEELRLTEQLTLPAGAWVAVRAYCKGIAAAHSAPVYVLVGDSKSTFDYRTAEVLANKYIGILDTMLRSEPLPIEDLEHFDTGAETMRQWKAQLPALEVQAKKSRTRLQAIAREAASSRVRQK